MLRTDGPRERILLMGGWGVGKSTAAVEVAKQLSGKMMVVDTTYEADRNFAGVQQAMVCRVESWDDCLGRVREFRAAAKADDWLLVDRMDPVWDHAQAGFSEKAFGKNIADWFVEYKADQGKGHPFSGDYGLNWTVIKRMYAEFVTEVMRFPGHVIVTAKAEMVQQPNRDGSGGDKPELRAVYGKFGVRPAGEKNLGFQFHTTLLLSEVVQGQWTYTTVRDRGREQVTARPMKNFVTSYLVPIAGWKLGQPTTSSLYQQVGLTTQPS